MGDCRGLGLLIVSACLQGECCSAHMGDCRGLGLLIVSAHVF